MSKKTKKIIVELRFKMAFSEAATYFPLVAGRIAEYKRLPIKPNHVLTMQTKTRILTELNLLRKLADIDLDAEKQVIERFSKSAKQFDGNLNEQIRVHRGSRPFSKTSIHYGKWKKEEGWLLALTQTLNADLEKLIEQYKRMDKKLKAWNRIMEEFVKVQDICNEEIKLHTKWVKDSHGFEASHSVKSQILRLERLREAIVA